MMNKTEIRNVLRALSQEKLVSEFSRRHLIPLRTIWRVRKKGSTPSKRTLMKFEEAILWDRAAGLYA